MDEGDRTYRAGWSGRGKLTGRGVAVDEPAGRGLLTAQTRVVSASKRNERNPARTRDQWYSGEGVFQRERKEEKKAPAVGEPVERTLSRGLAIDGKKSAG
jgi:hypothetical protein